MIGSNNLNLESLLGYLAVAVLVLVLAVAVAVACSLSDESRV